MIAVLTDFVQFIAIIFEMCLIVRTLPANNLMNKKNISEYMKYKYL